MLTQIDLSALADYIVFTLECDPEYEDDSFAFSFEGQRIYAERYISHYRLEIGHEDNVVELPRC